jgi:hypothetical protein
MLDAVPPVTRASTFATSPGPENVAVCPLVRLKLEKLWKRLAPAGCRGWA